MNVTIKGIPDEIGAALKVAAEHSRRSMNGEIIHRLASSLKNVSAPEISSRVLETPDSVADAWTSLAGRWKSDMSVEDEIAALYQARSIGREVDVSW
ncbi:MAG: Arc family DNA-binding protein [Luteolibacter sp.]